MTRIPSVTRIAAFACFGVLCLLHPAVVQAGGLYLTEWGQPSMGTSSAGATVLAEDASVVFTNPAGIVKLEEAQMMVAGMAIFTSAKFDQSPGTTVTAAGGAGPGSNGGDAGGFAAAGSFFYVRPVSERWGFGTSVISVSGAVLDYEDSGNFVGRYWAERSSLLTVTVAPSVAYKVSEDFSIAFGLPITLGVLEMDVAIPAPTAGGVEGLAEISEGKDIGVTGSVSFLWDVTDRSRLGLVYLGETEFDFEGDLDLTLPGGGVGASDVDVNVEIPLAQTVRLSGSLDVSDRVTLLATLAWEDWSTLDALPISTSAGGSALTYDWDDTWRYALGARIRGAGKWTWYTGAAFDTDPTSASKRTADLPVDRQIRLSAGARFNKSERVTLGGAITIADLGDAEIDNGGVRPVTGDSWAVEGDFGTNRAVFVAFNVNWK